jgi:hypothetical protein
MNCARDGPAARFGDRIAGLVGDGTDSVAATNMAKHLWHERHTSQSTVGVYAPKNLLDGPHLDPIADAWMPSSRYHHFVLAF